MLEPLAVSVSTYAPCGPVIVVRFVSVKVMLSDVVSVCEPVSKLPPPSRVNFRSSRSKPVTASLKTIVIEPTGALRGSGETAVIETVGTVASIRHASVSPVASKLLARSATPDEAAVSVRK